MANELRVIAGVLRDSNLVRDIHHHCYQPLLHAVLILMMISGSMNV